MKLPYLLLRGCFPLRTVILSTLTPILFLPICSRADNSALTVERGTNEIFILWPASAGQFELEQAYNLASPILWSPVTNLPSLVGTQLQVVLPAIDTNRFFRLRSTSLPLTPFNTFIDFNLTMESAANPSCGCGNEPTYGQGVSLLAGGCADCGASPAVAGVGQDAGFGSVLLHNGELVHYVVDLEIAGRGFNWQFARKYRSGITFDGPLGRNWEFNYNRRLFVETNGHVLRLDGSARADRYLVQTNGSYVSPRGFYTKLIQNLNGSFTERDRHGTIVEYAPPGTNSVARMTELRDRNGNRMRFEYDGLSRLVRAFDTFDRQIDYRYDSSNRLTEVEDFIGRKLTYQYDSFGNLTSATSPVVTNTPNANDFPAGKTTRYTYSSGFGDERLNHNLLTITAPNEAAGGPPRMRVEYETNSVSPHLDRITMLRLGGTNISNVPAGGSIAYSYQVLGPANSNDFLTAVFQTTVTDRNGNLTEYQFNQLGNIVRGREFSNRDVRPGDPVFFETRYEYNADGEMTRLIYPETNSVVYAYDTANPDRFQQGNLLQITRSPDAARGGDQTNLLATFRYEPLFNQVYTKTEPRGNDPAYTPPNGGANSPGRYTATNTFDYQEASAAPLEAATWGITIPPALLGLGDVNGDAQTNQAMGNRIRRQLPTVNLLVGSNQALAEGDTQQEIITRFTYNQFGQLRQSEDARGNLDTLAYFPENDPDGDGLDLIAGRNTVTGGHESQSVRDAFIGPNRLDPPPAVAITNRFQRDRAGNITRHTDGRGLDYRYTYNALNQLVQEEKPKVDASQATGYLTRYFYDANNNLVRRDLQNVTTDPTNHLPVIVAGHPYFQHGKTYDMLDHVVEEARDATRDPAIAPSAQPELLTTRHRYDANGNLVQIISPLAVTGAEPDNVERTLYDERDLIYQTTRGGVSAGASTYTYDYDRNGNRVRFTDAEDNDATPGAETETTVYDGFDRRRSVTDRAGNEQRSTYDPEGRVVREDFFGPSTASSTTNTLLRRIAHLFDELGRQFQADRALFLATGVTQQVATTLLDGPLTPGDRNVSERNEYDALSRMTFRVEDDNAVYRYDYDGAGRRIRETLPLVDNITPGGPYPTKTEYEYDRNNNVVRRAETHTSPEGVVPPALLRYLSVYDALNRPLRVNDPLGQTHYSEYDSRDNVVAGYDARGPLMPDPLGLYTTGNINERGNVTRHAYDGVNRFWREEKELTTTGDGGAPRDLTNPFNADGLVVLQTEHDANSRIASRTDDTANRTVFAYDVLNRRVAQTNADGGFRTWQYDRDDHQIQLRDENNTLHTFGYDALGRRVTHQLAPDLTKTNSAGLPLLVGTTLQTFAYDGLSRLIRCTDNNDRADTNDDWTVQMKYDSLNRVVEEVQNGRAVSSGYLSDDRTELHYPGTSRVMHFAYDAHDQFKGLSNSGVVSINFNLKGAHCPPAVLTCGYAVSNLASSLVVNQALNANLLVTQIEQTSSTLGQIGGHFFNRNRNNDVISAFRMARNGSDTINQNLALELDSLDRQSLFASQIQTPSGGTALTRRQSFSGAQDVPLVRDGQNQIVQQVNQSPTHEPQGGFLLSNASPGTGIRTRDTNFVFQWDGLNRLRVVRSRTAPTNEVARYTYDAHPAIHGGRRVQRTVTSGGPVIFVVSTTRFYYDGANCIEETFPSAPERVTRQFLYGRRADEVLAMDADTDNDGNPDQLSFYLRDHNNNVTQLVDASGQPIEFYLYDYRGQPLIFDAATLTPLTNSTRGNPWLFTGQRYDAETGLYYYKARYYDPVYGVFLSRDPMSFWHDAANHGNPMAYVGNNFWNRKDPSGLATHCYFYFDDDAKPSADLAADPGNFPAGDKGVSMPVPKGSSPKQAAQAAGVTCCDTIGILGHGYTEGHGLNTPSGPCGVEDAEAQSNLDDLGQSLKAILCNADRNKELITVFSCWGATIIQTLANITGTKVKGVTGCTSANIEDPVTGEVRPTVPRPTGDSKWVTAEPGKVSDKPWVPEGTELK